jgi:putative ABC transport system permease protein
MTFLGMVSMAFSGLARKRSRNALTMLGVFIGVFALTMIISLGEGLSAVVTGTVSGDDNLRQISLLPGVGQKQDNEKDIAIEGEMSEARRARLRRAARARREFRGLQGGAAVQLTPEVLDDVRGMEHVVEVRPHILRRYQIEYQGVKRQPGQSTGIDTERGRYRERLVAGSYPSSPTAPEVLVHEYLLYQWGLRDEAAMGEAVGRKITLRSFGAEESALAMPQPTDIRELFKGVELNAKEQEALLLLMPKLQKVADNLRGPQPASRNVMRELTIVGVLRETEAGDPVNLLEDLNNSQVDLFLPDGLARAMQTEAQGGDFRAGRAIITVDSPDNAIKVEEALREKGYSAFSVAQALERSKQALLVITVILSFLTGIAMVVATLGIVNTMITSVLERTREIGVWKAIGATNFQVQSIFILESGIIGLVGGLAGLGVAAALMIPGDWLAQVLIEDRTTIPFNDPVFRLPVWLAVSGPVLGAAVAMLAAIYPARRAARVDPVTALRHD